MFSTTYYDVVDYVITVCNIVIVLYVITIVVLDNIVILFICIVCVLIAKAIRSNGLSRLLLISYVTLLIYFYCDSSNIFRCFIMCLLLVCSVLLIYLFNTTDKYL